MYAVLIDGSPADNSCVAAALNAIGGKLELQECTVQTLALRDMLLPVNNPAYHNAPLEHPETAVRDFAEQVQGAGIVMLGTPLYHGSFSGLMKMALDHLGDDAFGGKVVGALSNAQGPRNAVQAAQELVSVARTMKGHVVNRLLGTCRSDYELRGEVLELVQPAVRSRAEQIAEELVAAAQTLADARK